MAYQNPSVYLVSTAGYSVDEDTRIDLSNNNIVSERDYVSNFTKGLRDFWTRNGFPAFSYSRTLNQSEENIFGCDGIILLKYISGIKACLFEAKYPRFNQSNYKWDRLVNSKSHFTDQIHRQRKWAHFCAIWEMFIVECFPKQQHHALDDFGSTCVSHNDTDVYDQAFRKASTPWLTSDIFNLLATSKRRYYNLWYMLKHAAQCYSGKITTIKSGYITITSENDEQSVKIPGDLGILDNAAPTFLEEYHLSNFLFIDFTDRKV